jgi:DNA-binding response OmpR family regulator
MRALVVDDHSVAPLRALLESDLEVEVLEASNGIAAYSLYFARAPDIAIVNLNAFGLSGLKLIRRSATQAAGEHPHGHAQ